MLVAASTADLVQAVAARWEQQTGVQVHINAASSSTLARQIEMGAPADLFLSANRRWMDAVVRLGYTEQTPDVLFANRLHFAGLVGSERQPWDQSDISFSGHLAMGDPDHVPLGMYGKQALLALGIWADLEPRIAKASSAQHAVQLVLSGACSVGLLYASDVKRQAKLMSFAVVPSHSHQPIHYFALNLAPQKPQAARFYAFLFSPEAQALAADYGFELVGIPAP